MRHRESQTSFPLCNKCDSRDPPPSISPSPGDPGVVCCRDDNNSYTHHVNVVEQVLVSQSNMGLHK